MGWRAAAIARKASYRDDCGGPLQDIRDERDGRICIKPSDGNPGGLRQPFPGEFVAVLIEDEAGHPSGAVGLELEHGGDFPHPEMGGGFGNLRMHCYGDNASSAF